MPRRPKGSAPSLQHHKPSNRARVTINGRDHWLGKWGSPEAQLAYKRLVAEYLATGRVRDPEHPSTEATVVALDPGTPGMTVVTPRSPAPAAPEENVSAEPTVAEVVLRYLEYCDTYYRTPLGERTSTYGNALQAARALRPFDDTLAAKFGPRKLGMIRDSEAARAACFLVPALAFFRAFSVLVKNGSRQPKPSASQSTMPVSGGRPAPRRAGTPAPGQNPWARSA